MSAAAKNDPALDEAAEIYQQHLDRVSNLLLKGDVAECVTYFGLPLLIRTRGGETLIETHDDIVQDTEQHSKSLQGHGVTNYIRLVKQARRHSDTLIEGWHETYILRHANSILPSYKSHMFIRLDDDGRWKVAEAEHELGDVRFPLHAVSSQPGSFAQKWQQPLSDIRATHTRAEPLYAVFLNRMDTLQNAGDFDAWSAQFLYPLDAHYDSTDRDFETAEEMRPFFGQMQELMSTGNRNLHRNISSADFIAGDRICGYHNTTITEGGQTVFGPVKSRMILTLLEGRWYCSSITNSLSVPDADISEFTLSSDLPTMREIEKRKKK